jgi:FkbM family methyltransferase
MPALLDPLGQFIKATPEFRGKGRLLNYWMKNRGNDKRMRELPGGARVLCDLSIPYEAMVWLEREEQKDLRLLCLLLGAGQTFVDCGANIGIWTLVASSAVGPTGEVHAFEPNPHTFEKLSSNVLLSGMNPKLYNRPLGHVAAEFLFECHKSHNISSIVAEDGDNVISVSAVTLDSILVGKHVDGMKIDVEGFEMNVLQGSENILEKSKPWLCVEFNTILAKVTRLADWDVHRFLRDMGYRCRQFHDALDTSMSTVLPDYWQTSGYCNLFYRLP